MALAAFLTPEAVPHLPLDKWKVTPSDVDSHRMLLSDSFLRATNSIGCGMTIQTITGPIDGDKLGQTLMHEHVFVFNLEMTANYNDFDVDSEIVKAIARLNDAYDRGVSTIVDLTVLGLGR